MKRCRTKAGSLKLRHEGKDYLLDGEGMSLPDDLAESIRSHVNVIHEDDEVHEDDKGEEEPGPDQSQPRSSRKKGKSEAEKDASADDRGEADLISGQS